ncbi:hypothetical protein [Saguinine gammaherpesvirus 1]|uniref:Uncharacterized protein n=1 Tax=Saguinine gammaherpesvirus 1 TaxID=2169901 RepID=A0A9Q8VJA6_9GAMA|nr:hypothetical protein [Saguinine gammaherpesvirus 1]
MALFLSEDQLNDQMSCHSIKTHCLIGPRRFMVFNWLPMAAREQPQTGVFAVAHQHIRDTSFGEACIRSKSSVMKADTL